MRPILGPLACCLLILAGSGVRDAACAEHELAFDASHATIEVQHAGQAVRPTFYLVGQPDRSTKPVRKTKGLTVKGLRLTETLLSESVLILRPDGTGSWGYHAGFDQFREPEIRGGKPIDPRTLVENDKWRYDPLEPVVCVGGNIQLLWLHGQRPNKSALYEIAFPPSIRIRSFAVNTNCDQIRAPGVAVHVRLYADRQRKQLIAQNAVGPEAAQKKFPLVFADLDHDRVYLELSAQTPGIPLGLYRTFFEARLDTSRLKLPELIPGRNRWAVGDDADSSHRARIVLRWDEQPVTASIPPIQEWFPCGVYDGICRRSNRECEWMFTQMKKHHMNAVYVSNGSPKELLRIVPLAEKYGIRLIYQGGGEAALYYLHLDTPEARKQSLDRLLKVARQWIPQFRGRWGLAAWSLTEEIAPQLSPELAPYYELVRQLDPAHPPTVLHNNLAAAKVDLERNHPLVVTHDFYPFFWSPRSGPSSPELSVATFRRQVRQYYEACRKHGASLWMMPQAWGEPEQAPLDPPNYGYRTGMRLPEPGEIKLQGWVAVAEGATGVMYYATLPELPNRHHLWDAGWQETPNTRAAGELFARLKRVAPLLCRLERDYGEKDFVQCSSPRVLAHSFKARPAYKLSGRYVVLASLDGFQPQSCELTIQSNEPIHDLVSGRKLSARPLRIVLGPGEGTVLGVGESARVLE